MPCAWVGPPTTRRSALDASSWVTWPAGRHVASIPQVAMPCAIANATAAVLPYIDSYTTKPFIVNSDLAGSSRPPVDEPIVDGRQERGGENDEAPGRVDHDVHHDALV